CMAPSVFVVPNLDDSPEALIIVSFATLCAVYVVEHEHNRPTRETNTICLIIINLIAAPFD
ncbi:MAG: hypothetical protein WCP33_03265, partial [Deltaproteobacteria bacterium]